MRRRVIGIFVFVLAACLTLRAERLPIKIYTTVDGLAHNDINRIVKDSHGFLWFCTADGLSRFDGYAFTNFSIDQGLPDSAVNDLLETRAGEYWVATNAGLVRFDPKGRPGRREVAEKNATPPAPMFADAVPADDEDRRARTITVVREGADGTIWVGTNNGLYRLENANGRRSLRPIQIQLPDEYPLQREIADVLEDAHGSLWIAATTGLYRRWPDGTAARYTTRDGLPHDFVQDLLQDHAGQLWAGTRLAGFFRFSADASHRPPVVNLRYAHQQQDPNGLAASWVFQLFETSDRRFWVATAKGLAEFFPNGDVQGRHFRQYSEKNGLSYFDVTALNEDLGGNLWMGTNTAGAMKLTRGGFRTYGDPDGIKTVNAIFEDRSGRICFRGNVLGDTQTSVFEGAKLDVTGRQPITFHTRLGCFDGQRFDWFKPRAVSMFGWVTEQVTLQSRSGEWWVGSTSEGLFRFAAADSLAALKTARPLAVYSMKDELAPPLVFRLFEDSRGNIWVSTVQSSTNGLARWEPGDKKLRDLARSNGLPSLKEDLPRSFGEDRSGAIWIGFNGGLARHTQGRFQFFTTRDGLPPGAIMNIYADHSGRIWLASARGGLVRVDDAGADRPTFVSYTTAQGLSSNNTEVITEDLHGRLYIGGGHGLDRLDPATGLIKHFTTADGLAPGLFRAAFRDRAGVLWFGMTSGLARLAPEFDTPPAPPPVLISAVRVTGIPQHVSSLGEREMSLPDLRPDQNQLQIDFVGLAFGPGEVLRYQYRLDGADADWSAPSEQRTVTYASLPPGRHTFIVRAVNSDGAVSAPPAAMTFTILRPVWQRWWFLTLVTLVVGLAVYSLHRYRVARLLEMANLRTRIATDLHDDIGANLTRIALLSEVAKQTRAETLEETGPLSSIARIARESIGSMSDIVWAINPARDSLLDLTRRMRQHAEEVFTLRGIELRFNAPGANASTKLGVDVRRDLLLTFKEAVNNSARHARCSRVEIDLSVKGSRLVFSLVDDGVGFDTSLESGGQGLASLKRRAHRLKGTLEITSGPGMGTTVTLSIPV